MPVVIVGLGIVLRFGVAFGLRWLWIVTVGAFLGWLASRFIRISIARHHPLRGIGNAILTVNRNIERSLDLAVIASEAAAVLLFNAIGHQLERVGYDLATFAVAAAQRVSSLTIEIPKVAHRAGRAAAAAMAASLLAHYIRKLTVAVHHQTARIGHLEHAVYARLRLLARGIDRLRVRVIPAIRARVGRAEARVGRLERRLAAEIRARGRAVAGAGTIVGAAAVAAALSRLGLRWLRCSNVNRAGKAICGMNSSLLTELLLDVALLGIAFDLEEFARDCQSVTGETTRIIRGIVD